MQSPTHIAASTWLRVALWLTTSSVPAEGAFAVTGWRVRTAVPKWWIVWRGHVDAQRRLCAIVLPKPWIGWDDPIWQALLHQRLHAVGLCPDEPDPRLLLQAEREIFARLAPPWTNMMARRYR